MMEGSTEEPNPEPFVQIHRDAVDAGERFYFDPTSGLLVMTELHHLDRGTCCTTGCRHCPYR